MANFTNMTEDNDAKCRDSSCFYTSDHAALPIAAAGDKSETAAAWPGGAANSAVALAILLPLFLFLALRKPRR